MKSDALRSILYAQVFLYGGLLVAIALKPVGLRVNDGISYYGIFARTIAPYLVALIGAALCYWNAADAIAERSFTPLRQGMKLATILVIIIAATPYSVDSFTNWTHMIAGALLFILELMLSGWLVVQTDYNPLSILLALIELGAAVACAVYLRPAQGFLLQCQLLVQACFATLLIYSLKKRFPAPIRSVR